MARTNKRAIRFATNKGHETYENICKQEKQLTIHKRGMQSLAVLMYKVRKDMSPSYLRELFKKQETQYDMRDNEKFSLPQYNTITYGRNSVKYLGAKSRNDIPSLIRKSPSLNTFKSAVKNWLLTQDNGDVNNI